MPQEKKRFVFPVQKKWAIAALVVLALGAGYWFRTAIFKQARHSQELQYLWPGSR